jgi:GH15 family glucan-1,4-alpha-glucosidase
MRPIEDYALIGDCRTGALVSAEGSVDWLCLPAFDGEPIFGRLIDPDNGGSFVIRPEGRSVSRRYRDDSVVLETTWEGAGGRATLTDGFVTNVHGGLLPDNLLVRRLDVYGSARRVRVLFDPRYGLPGRSPRAAKRGGALICAWGVHALAVVTSRDIDLLPGDWIDVVVEPGRPLIVAMSHVQRAPLVVTAPDHAWRHLDATDRQWRSWAGDLQYDGPHRRHVTRSLITLRLLTFSPSAAPVAAPTTSLPEAIAAGRNWDYRFSWPRDASIGLNAFVEAGKTQEAEAFMRWLSHATRLTRPALGVLYNIYGKRPPTEREVDGVAGYRGSLPVRIGNGASTQHQLDTYGWVLDAAATFADRVHAHDPATWRVLQAFADHVAAVWREPDAGIWEKRSEPQHHVHSKLMAWLALDRMIKAGSSHRTPSGRLARWTAERDALAADIRTRGFDSRRGVYVQSYGTHEMDAALLVLPVLEFDTRERVLRTIRAIQSELSPRFPLLYRYRRDDLAGQEGVFLPVCFWLVQALARTGQVDEARHGFDELCAMANDVGLFAEELDPSTGAHLGNFPQAFTHAALVQAALALSAA